MQACAYIARQGQLVNVIIQLNDSRAVEKIVFDSNKIMVSFKIMNVHFVSVPIWGKNVFLLWDLSFKICVQ